MSMTVRESVHYEYQDRVAIRVRRATSLRLAKPPDGSLRTFYKTPTGIWSVCTIKPEPLESISEDEDNEEDEKQYEIVIDEMKTILLAPRFDFIKSETKAYDQIKRMAPKQMKRKVIILGAPSVGMFLFLRVKLFLRFEQS
jgi:hypothetical protein